METSSTVSVVKTLSVECLDGIIDGVREDLIRRYPTLSSMLDDHPDKESIFIDTTKRNMLLAIDFMTKETLKVPVEYDLVALLDCFGVITPTGYHSYDQFICWDYFLTMNPANRLSTDSSCSNLQHLVSVIQPGGMVIVDSTVCRMISNAQLYDDDVEVVLDDSECLGSDKEIDYVASRLGVTSKEYLPLLSVMLRDRHDHPSVLEIGGIIDCKEIRRAYDYIPYPVKCKVSSLHTTRPSRRLEGESVSTTVQEVVQGPLLVSLLYQEPAIYHTFHTIKLDGRGEGGKVTDDASSTSEEREEDTRSLAKWMVDEYVNEYAYRPCHFAGGMHELLKAFRCFSLDHEAYNECFLLPPNMYISLPCLLSMRLRLTFNRKPSLLQL